MKKDVTGIVVRGIITATSDKQSQDFDVNTELKTVHFVPQNDTEREKLIEFGLQEYGKEHKYFMAKLPKTFKHGNVTRSGLAQTEANIDEGTGEIIDNPNFHSDGNIVALALFKGEKSKNVFYRITRIHGVLVNFEVDPFADEDLGDIVSQEEYDKGLA